MDQVLGASGVPLQVVLKLSCPSRNIKMPDAVLGRKYGAVTIQGQLVNRGDWSRSGLVSEQLMK